VIEWNYISAELGFVFGFGIVIIGPLMFWKKWRIWYYRHVDDILLGFSPNCILKKNIIIGANMEIKGRGTSHSYACSTMPPGLSCMHD
jgi:hypothetical protein